MKKKSVWIVVALVCFVVLLVYVGVLFQMAYRAYNANGGHACPFMAQAVREGLVDANNNPVTDPKVCATIMELYKEYTEKRDDIAKRIVNATRKEDSLAPYSACLGDLEQCPEVCKNPGQSPT